MQNLKKVVVSKESKEKLESLFCWVYRNEIVNDIGHIQSGEIVKIQDQNANFLALGYINPLSEITLRVLSFNDEPINSEFFSKRIKNAITKRKAVALRSNAARLIHSEADMLPGLIVDSYNGYLGVQFNTYGIEQYRSIIIHELIRQCAPKGIYDKSDAKVRRKEGLSTTNEVIYGEVAPQILINEDGIEFEMSLIEGQKTGFYLDQRANREIVSRYINNKDSVLDIFCNAGGFGLHALQKGAEVTFVDLSQNALSQVESNLKLNNLMGEIIRADAFEYLTQKLQENNRYDAVLLDPPPFAKTKKEVHSAMKGMKFLLQSGVKLAKEGGVVAIFSCSHHISINELLDLAKSASKESRRFIEVLETMRADIDHPYIVSIPNSNYLSGLLVRVY